MKGGLAQLLPMALAGISLGWLGTGCTPGHRPITRAAAIQQLVCLDAGVQPAEATVLVNDACDEAHRLKLEYDLVRPPLWHNLLVNLRLRERGLCFHWADDLGATLAELHLESLEMHRVVARPGSWREHNALVITARGQPFTEGVLLDAWRSSGNVFWGPVPTDSYPWQEDRCHSALQNARQTDDARLKSVSVRKNDR